MQTNSRKILLTAFFVMSFLCNKGFSQIDSAALANADTTAFAANTGGGWQLYNSYAAVVDTDSVLLELVLTHNNSINWSVDQPVGRIKQPSLFPAVTREVSFMLLSEIWLLRVENDGDCYLRFVAGSLPVGSRVVIPVKIAFKQ